MQIYDYGTNGVCQKTKGSKIENLVYLMLECIGGGLLFDVVQTMGGMGEDYGRFFMNQMLDSLEFMQAKGVSHRDLKLENILVDE